MFSCTGLSLYQVILQSKSRVLLANCPHEAEPMNRQVSPCNAVSSGVYPAASCATLWIAAVLRVVFLLHGVLPAAYQVGTEHILDYVCVCVDLCLDLLVYSQSLPTVPLKPCRAESMNLDLAMGNSDPHVFHRKTI